MHDELMDNRKRKFTKITQTHKTKILPVVETNANVNSIWVHRHRVLCMRLHKHQHFEKIRSIYSY